MLLSYCIYLVILTILLLFFFSPLFFDLTLLPCFLYLFLFWKRFSDSGISFVNNVFSIFCFLVLTFVDRMEIIFQFLQFTLITLTWSTSITTTEGREIGVGLSSWNLTAGDRQISPRPQKLTDVLLLVAGRTVIINLNQLHAIALL